MGIEKKRMFHTADPKEIKEGKLTDIYFVRIDASP